MISSGIWVRVPREHWEHWEHWELRRVLRELRIIPVQACKLSTEHFFINSLIIS